jgi:Na+/H+-translocating membrane pyrophosphatase
MPKKTLLILSSSFFLGVLFVFFVETRLVSESRGKKEMLYQSGIKEGKFAYLAKENMLLIDDNTVYANCTTMIVKSKEKAQGFIEGYHSFEK